MKRREFIKKTALTTTALAMAPFQVGNANPPRLPQRPYGRSDVRLSIIGMGGIVVMNAEQDHANRVVAEAVERGVNYFDVAPSYGDAELKLGPALEPFRKNVFLACKTTHRTAEAAKQEFAQSLQRLRTDYFDLYQLHAITDVVRDVDGAFAEGGIMPWLMEQKKSGRVRHVGFSAHSVEAATAAMDRYDFDSILFPINFATYYKGNFGPTVMAAAQAKGVSRLALKALAKQKWPEGHPRRKEYPKCWYEPLSDPTEAELGLKFTLSQEVTAALPPGEESLFRLALDLAMGFQPITPRETQQVREMADRLNPIFAV